MKVSAMCSDPETNMSAYVDQSDAPGFTCVRLEVSSYRNHLTVLLSDSSNYLILSNIIKTVRKMKSYSK